MDQFATAVRQVARTLWAVHVTLQMGFEEEVRSDGPLRFVSMFQLFSFYVSAQTIDQMVMVGPTTLK